MSLVNFNSYTSLNKFSGIKIHDYGARWYDAGVGRFTTVDPIIEKFAFLTPYNYASNDPIGKIDLYGLQGVQFTEIQKGKTVRVVEADVHIGVGNNGFTQKDIARIDKVLNKSFDTKIDGQKVDFRFNVRTFDANISDAVKGKASELRRSSIVETGTVNKDIPSQNKRSITAMAIGKGDLPAGTQGQTSINATTISNNVIDQNHTVTHEVGHFLMLGSPDQPVSDIEHNKSGGIFKYGVNDPIGNVIESTLGVSKSNVIKILENVPLKKQ